MLPSSSSEPPSPTRSPKGTLRGGKRESCAACKHQRRRCSSGCSLAPYFPASEADMFKIVHGLFGICNVLKILEQATDELKADAMRSVKYEAIIRQLHPVHGCKGIVYDLCRMLTEESEKLKLLKTQLAICKSQNGNQIRGSITNGNEMPTGESDLYLYDL